MGNIKLENGDALRRTGTLVCIDGSYVIYHTLFSAVNEWTRDSPYSDCITDVDVEEEGFEQVDITQYADFVETLKGRFIEILQKIKNMVSEYNSTMFSDTYGDMLFVLDPEHGSKSRSWRYEIYPEYKGQRKSAREKKPYDVYKIFAKSVELLRENGDMERRFGMRIVSADNAEADDIIATVFMDEDNAGFNKFLVASDRDYLQLENVTQMNIMGDAVQIEQPYPELMKVTPQDYLLAKILTGDTSDNITQVFYKVGYKTAIKKYVSNLEFLNESLENDAVAMEKFNRNTRLIDFARIPKRIRAAAKNAIALS